MTDIVATNQTILVVGAGISGMTAALEAADCGKDVVLVEKNPSVGGRVGQLYKYFPKMCHPTCGMEINLRRLRAQKRVRLMTLTEVVSVSGEAGNYSVRLHTRARHVNANCTACGECSRNLTLDFDDEFQYGLSKRKGAYLPFDMAHPQRYVVDPRILGSEDAATANAACRYDAIDLDEQDRSLELNVGAVIWATGWKPYDANKIQAYGYDRIANVITSVELERMMDPRGPTGGKLLRPSDGQPARDVAFIQCAGSRDRNHLSHCSRVCCMASLKQSTYLREQFGDDGKATIYYIDIRAIDRFEDFYLRVQQDDKVGFIKSKVASISEDRSTGRPILHGVDTEGYHRYSNHHDLAVLAVGMQPSVDAQGLAAGVTVNRSGFIEADEGGSGIFAAGCAADALDVNRSVQHATASAMRAIQVVNRAAAVEV